ncbi:MULTISPECIES: hypothetical protein [Rhizobium]|uniref:hypothetical protein n=1 Tax=Rhizobium TaxID=379 RepID=UPI0007E93BAE|nr:MULTISPECIES: hypothetical protein [Rhizobium]ANK95302.1 hypothetical protein AMK01_PD00423 [Rhizobium sp. N6212]ANL01355.1 hypothetical protein AMK00_PD00422 [Rhizobium sp. N621]ANL07478.1 hypothetical protein AMJ99_PD00424 [Rhizobium esperanzae]ANL13648.1 hypothetical protein AMJ98_PE00424 [Rhizobium sp. N1341]ANL25633.1 hypothetical protein AMJ96_PD00430 [Rhizobium sp. N113]
MTTSPTNMSPESGTDDARSFDTPQAEADRQAASEAARRNVRSTLDRGGGNETPSLKLAKEYLSLGGRRRSKIDDNITNVRQWDEDPPAAERFWKERVETLSKDERKQVEDFLPTINTP